MYVKKLPKNKEYRSLPKRLRDVLMLKTKKKLSIIIVLLGVTLISFTGYFELISKDKTVSILNPIPLNQLSQQIRNSNTAIDNRNPLNKYISTNDHSIDSKYTGMFIINFPSLNLTNIKVQANVDSDKPKIYEEVLKNSAAHFKGTSLPDEGGNTFIYAHSSVMWYHYLYPYSYEGIFSSLFDLKTGDKIVVNFKDKDYTYIVEGIMTIDATDFTQIKNITGINTLTLMTCNPPGVGDKRLIVKAIQI